MISWLVNIIFFFLPPSPNRLGGFKRFLLRLSGHSIARHARVMRIRVQGVKVCLGNNTFIGDETLFCGSEGTHVVIGANCDISSKVSFVTGSHKFSLNPDKCAGEGYGEDIIVEDGTWIGFGSTILGGVKIGKCSMIAAGATVAKSIPPYQLWGGVPAKFIKSLR